MSRRDLPQPETIEEFLEHVPEQLRETARAELLRAQGQGAASWQAVGRRPVQISFLERTAPHD